MFPDKHILKWVNLRKDKEDWAKKLNEYLYVVMEIDAI